MGSAWWGFSERSVPTRAAVTSSNRGTRTLARSKSYVHCWADCTLELEVNKNKQLELKRFLECQYNPRCNVFFIL